jgi:O-antigen/teichoic acid export membrane protein
MTATSASRSISTAINLTVVRMLGVVLQMLILLVVGRLTGPQGVGMLQLFNVWTCILGEFTASGLPTHAMRRLATRTADRDAPATRNFLAACMQRMALVWLLVMLALAALLPFLSSDIASDVTGNVAGDATVVWQGTNGYLLALAIFAFAVTRLTSDSLKARSSINTGVLGESAGPPLVAALVLLVQWQLNNRIDSGDIIVAFTTGFVITALALLACLLAATRAVPATAASNMKAQPEASEAAIDMHWQSHAPLWLTALVSIAFLNYPFLVLPHFASMAEVGTFAIAFKLLNLVTTIIVMLAAIYGPRFARCELTADFQLARTLLRQSQVVSLVLYLPVVAVMLLSYEHLHPLFGQGFAGGVKFLGILAIGQGINATCGLTGLMLNMMGQGKTELATIMIITCIALLLTPWVGATYGAVGIAAIYSGAIAAKNLLSYCLAMRYLNRMQFTPTIHTPITMAHCPEVSR